MTERAKYWYVRGRKASLRQEPQLHFDAAPAHWTAPQIREAEDAYQRGVASALMEVDEYGAVQLELRETESLASSRGTSDPTRFWQRAAELRDRLADLENRMPARWRHRDDCPLRGTPSDGNCPVCIPLLAE